jgi:hypothetical protein
MAKMSAYSRAPKLPGTAQHATLKTRVVKEKL